MVLPSPTDLQLLLDQEIVPMPIDGTRRFPKRVVSASPEFGSFSVRSSEWPDANCESIVRSDIRGGDVADLGEDFQCAVLRDNGCREGLIEKAETLL